MLKDTSTSMLLVAIAWLALAVIVIRATVRSPRQGVGLPTAFLLSTTFAYCGAFVYAVPGYTHLRGDGSAYLQSYHFTAATVLAGASIALLGVFGFAIGSLAHLPSQRRGGRSERVHRSQPRFPHNPIVLRVLVGLGLAGFVLGLVHVEFPLVQAIQQVLRNLAPVAVCLGALEAAGGRRDRVAPWLMIGLLLPSIYVVGMGFTSYAFLVVSIYAAFWLATRGRRWTSFPRLSLGGGLSFYLSLCLFTAWMSFRDELRRVLWSDAGVGQRVSALAHAFGKTKLLSPFDFQSLDLINTRLDQSIFVGKASELLSAAPSLFQHGKTLALVFFAFVPRLIWADKPTMHDNTLLSQNTGLTFSTQATFGAGPVFEFYINFGLLGVFLGFLVLGYLLRSIDLAAGRALREERTLDCARWFTVGLAFVSPLISSFFIVNIAVFSWLFLTLLKSFLAAGAPRARLSAA